MEYRTKLRWKAAALAALLLLAFALPVAADSVLRRGSTGDAVVTVQKKLKQWGYYTGAVDGIFGSRTEAAVRYFQRKNGLTADGIVGKKTAAALGITLSGESKAGGAQSGSDGDVYLLARCIHGEARGEPYKGQVAVGAVILNRVALGGWDPTGGCLYYYNPQKTSNAWILSRPIMLRIGNHVFCK